MYHNFLLKLMWTIQVNLTVHKKKDRLWTFPSLWQYYITAINSNTFLYPGQHLTKTICSLITKTWKVKQWPLCSQCLGMTHCSNHLYLCLPLETKIFFYSLPFNYQLSKVPGFNWSPFCFYIYRAGKTGLYAKWYIHCSKYHKSLQRVSEDQRWITSAFK